MTTPYIDMSICTEYVLCFESFCRELAPKEEGGLSLTLTGGQSGESPPFSSRSASERPSHLRRPNIVTCLDWPPQISFLLSFTVSGDSMLRRCFNHLVPWGSALTPSTEYLILPSKRLVIEARQPPCIRYWALRWRIHSKASLLVPAMIGCWLLSDLRDCHVSMFWVGNLRQICQIIRLKCLIGIASLG